MTERGVVLLTGATGFLGREILWRLLRGSQDQVVCLVRAGSDEEAAARLAAVLDGARPAPLSAGERARARALPGDITREQLGLTPARWEELARELGRIVHGAASVRFDMPLDEARAVNVTGTERILSLGLAAAGRGCLERFDYVGTAYVAGTRAGPVGEEELDAGQGFHNTYEQTKFEAEKLVRERRGGLPVRLFRPSIVVGDSRTGFTSSFKVLYWPLKMLSRGLLFAVPARAWGVVDLVPVDYVCDAIEALSADPATLGKCFHLAAGPERASTIGDLLDLASRYFDARKPILIPPETFYSWVRPLVYLVAWGRRRQTLRSGRVYAPYLALESSFDTGQARTGLAGKGIEVPPVRDYFERIMDYAVRSDWGKAPADGA
ncbi:MAG: SDR family oxidoreductase [Planctomycetes bacterium]|nr:SDR family oxidoreductase [Planctomycetota bacterium]